MRCLVTGGAGFVGSHLCDRLRADGHAVVCMDNLYTSTRDNVAHLADDPEFELVEHDCIEPWPAMGGPFDRVFNLACPASPRQYQRDPLYTVEVNYRGTRRALERAAQDGARMLQASTSEVYGDPDVHPQHESYLGNVNALGPRACYDEGKRVAETLCADMHRAKGVDVRIARIFNTYGPRMAMDDGRVVSNFVIQALRGQPLTVYGEGTQTRSFCYVSDLVDGLIRLIEHPSERGPVNLGNQTELTMLELAKLVQDLTGARVPIRHLPLPQDDPRIRCPDLTLAQQRLGYEPRTPLADGLRQTVEHFRALLQTSGAA